MEIRSFQRSIRFTKREWDATIEAAERRSMTPGAFVRKTAARAAADELGLDGGGLTPELAELIKRTFRSVHLLARLKREELAKDGGEEDFLRAACVLRIHSVTFGTGLTKGRTAAETRSSADTTCGSERRHIRIDASLKWDISIDTNGTLIIGAMDATGTWTPHDGQSMREPADHLEQVSVFPAVTVPLVGHRTQHSKHSLVPSMPAPQSPAEGLFTLFPP